eukprot:1004952-Pelagomonas_calceolata.AAC.3
MDRATEGRSAGECQLSLKHGVSNKFQACWLQEYDRLLWPEDHGMDVDGVYKAECKWCGNVIKCHIGTIKIHDLGVKHRVKEQRTASAKQHQQQQQCCVTAEL